MASGHPFFPRLPFSFFPPSQYTNLPHSNQIWFKNHIWCFFARFSNPQAARRCKFYYYFQIVKMKSVLFFLMAWSLNCIELIVRETAAVSGPFFLIRGLCVDPLSAKDRDQAI
jgi:hypothetical protein